MVFEIDAMSLISAGCVVIFLGVGFWGSVLWLAAIANGELKKTRWVALAVLIVIEAVSGGCSLWLDKYYLTLRITEGTIKEACWECHSTNVIQQEGEAVYINRTTKGSGTTARCFTVGDSNWARNLEQKIMFRIVFATPLGEKVVEDEWELHYSSQIEFDFPIKKPYQLETTKKGSYAILYDDTSK